jgi:hypothetical protein
MALPGPLGLARRLAGSASFRVGALTSLGLLGAWLAQSTGAAQDLELHKFGEVRAGAAVAAMRGASAVLQASCLLRAGHALQAQGTAWPV